VPSKLKRAALSAKRRAIELSQLLLACGADFRFGWLVLSAFELQLFALCHEARPERSVPFFTCKTMKAPELRA
jgi:hypothetical protein